MEMTPPMTSAIRRCNGSRQAHARDTGVTLAAPLCGRSATPSQTYTTCVLCYQRPTARTVDCWHVSRWVVDIRCSMRTSVSRTYSLHNSLHIRHDTMTGWISVHRAQPNTDTLTFMWPRCAAGNLRSSRV